MFNISKTFEVVVEDVRKTGSSTVDLVVDGFWSSVATVYVRRQWGSLTQKPVLHVSISRSSGGRDSKEVEDDLTAERNFIQGYAALVEFAVQLRHANLLKQAYAEYNERIQAEEHAANMARQAAVASDTKITEQAAQDALSSPCRIRIMALGDTRFSKELEVWKTPSGSLFVSGFKFGKRIRISKRAAQELLMNSSVRSRIFPTV